MNYIVVWGFCWVLLFVQGLVCDLCVCWVLEEVGFFYEVWLIDFDECYVSVYCWYQLFGMVLVFEVDGCGLFELVVIVYCIVGELVVLMLVDVIV